ncbi:FAD-dependent oxidoreductase [Streptomyces sp. WMMC500]|uniref:FAD-dependent oxidoreductase n=1 Tax=Streptomyces sp. WMMC500 TaxID=3015154 RepID=UPI00248B3708|nr:FAD-dependent oxidoreductase [Streptomyces sp. WMMC500]WBB62208.1 FAD-dependent oxidoreductase [Streptomyces sp. WMMC500]
MGEKALSRRGLLAAGGAGLALPVLGAPAYAAAAGPGQGQADLVVYGGTSAGVIAAVQMRRMGGTAVVLEPTRHIGGLTTSGLGATDTGNTSAIGGLALEFYRRVYAKYHGTPVTDDSPARYTFEPHVASEVFADLLAEHDVPVVLGARLRSVDRRGGRIRLLVTDDGRAYAGRMYVDATYEGDLMFRAGVDFTTGREGNAAYDETLNGVQHRDKHQFVHPVDPYVTPGSPASGLLPGVSADPLEPNGTADDAIQAYCFRMCLTQAADRIPFPKPAGYDPVRYELLLRYVQAGWRGPFYTTHPMGGGKTDSNNNGAFSTDHIGRNFGHPTGTHAERARIHADHVDYQQGLMWFLANDPRLPESVRAQTAAWGLPRDEFTGHGGWPPLLYIREARRMVSAYVMTEHDCRGTVRAADSVGLASYTMDSHNCRRVVVDGVARNEGDVQVGVPAPYGISYRALTPKRAQCTNLLVPVALSASHIAYGSIRMEPVFMILAQSAATAARMALDRGGVVQEVPVAALQARLRADGQLLQWPPTEPGEIVVDNVSATGVTSAGTWLSSTSTSGYYGSDYVHDDNAGKGTAWMRFRPELPDAGSWDVALWWTAHANRATNVPVDVEHAGGTTTYTVDQRSGGGKWVVLGRHTCAAGTAASVRVRNDATDGYVIADAVRFTPA